MFYLLKMKKSLFRNRALLTIKLFIALFKYKVNMMNRENIFNQIILVGPQSLGLLIITAFFIGIVFTLQVVKEFLYLKASSAVGAILMLAFIRELSPILTAVILIGRVSSAFTAELATMKVTEQVDALYLLRVKPLEYLVFPRFIACLLMFPCLNLFFLSTSIFSSLFICFIFYGIHPYLFLHSIYIALSYTDFIKSSCKALAFGVIVVLISCSWGLVTYGGSRSVGESTTDSVVTSLLMIFILDCILTYLFFSQTTSIIKSL